YLSFISWAIGFLLARYFGNKTVGNPRWMKSYFLPAGKYRIHLHHWILSAHAIILFALLKGASVLPPVLIHYGWIKISPAGLFYGFFGSIVFHGIYYYNDWHKILIPRHKRNSIALNDLMIEETRQVPTQGEDFPPSV
ncbi:hypothetical protein ACFLTK_05515, partial [Chloroflexota bacterium]